MKAKRKTDRVTSCHSGVILISILALVPPVHINMKPTQMDIDTWWKTGARMSELPHEITREQSLRNSNPNNSVT